MALLFPRKRPALLGIDLSAAAVSVLELSRNEAGLRIKGFAIVPLATDVIVAHIIQDPSALSMALKLALSQAQVSTAYAAIALPATVVISKTLQVDASLGDEDLEATMQLEVASSIPYPLAEVYRDFCVLGLHEQDPAKADVLLVAARKQIVDSRIQVVQEAGLHLACVEVQSFALERMVNYLSSVQNMGKTIAVVEMSLSTIIFNVVHKGRAIYSREEAWLNQIESLMPLLRRFLQLFLSSGYSETVDTILLTSMQPHPEGLCERIAESLSIACHLLDPFKNMSLAPNLQQPASSLALACGLALRGVKSDDRD